MKASRISQLQGFQLRVQNVINKPTTCGVKVQYEGIVDTKRNEVSEAECVGMLVDVQYGCEWLNVADESE